MINIGMDIGTSWIKVYSADVENAENAKFKFPSVYAVRNNEAGKTIEAFGEDALKLNIHKNTKLMWPVTKGSIKGSEAEAEKLIRYAIKRVAGDEVNLKEINVGLGLPLRAEDEASTLTEILKKNIKVNHVEVWNQTLGTLDDQGVSTGIVVSIGHGTTEIMAYYEYEKIDGQSLKKASDTILEVLGGNKFLKHDFVKANQEKISGRVAQLVDEIVNKLTKIREGIEDEEIDNLPIFITGGGVEIPGVKEHLKQKMPYEYKIVQDPIFSIARGLYKSISTQAEPETENIEQAPTLTSN